MSERWRAGGSQTWTSMRAAPMDGMHAVVMELKDHSSSSLFPCHAVLRLTMICEASSPQTPPWLPSCQHSTSNGQVDFLPGLSLKLPPVSSLSDAFTHVLVQSSTNRRTYPKVRRIRGNQGQRGSKHRGEKKTRLQERWSVLFWQVEREYREKLEAGVIKELQDVLGHLSTHVNLFSGHKHL